MQAPNTEAAIEADLGQARAQLAETQQAHALALKSRVSLQAHMAGKENEVAGLQWPAHDQHKPDAIAALRNTNLIVGGLREELRQLEQRTKELERDMAAQTSTVDQLEKKLAAEQHRLLEIEYWDAVLANHTAHLDVTNTAQALDAKRAALLLHERTCPGCGSANTDGVTSDERKALDARARLAVLMAGDAVRV